LQQRGYSEVFGRPRAREAGELPVPRARDACLEPGCGSRGAIRCNYVDRRSRRCTTSWCSRHWSVAMGAPYCRRHASTVEAVAGSDFIEGLPDVDNRAPSLVGFVSRAIDAKVRAALTQQAAPATTLVVDPVRLVLSPGTGRRWQRTWKLVDHFGVLNRVTVEVEERDDAEVRALVDKELIGQGVPPWIERRRTGVTVPSEVAADERRAFMESMARSIELVVTRVEMAPQY
jgi:hypothetical protein